jgi:hypothetical protein
VTGEADHMGEYDFWGLLGTILVPGVLALTLPLIKFMVCKNKNES